MKGKRLVDVLDEDVKDNSWVMDKFLKLQARIHSHNPNIDDVELRWVEHKLEQLDHGLELTKNELLQANLYWKKWEL